MNQKVFVNTSVIILILAIAGGIYWLKYINIASPITQINNFQDCFRAVHGFEQIFIQSCTAPDGRVFPNPEWKKNITVTGIITIYNPGTSLPILKTSNGKYYCLNISSLGTQTAASLKEGVVISVTGTLDVSGRNCAHGDALSGMPSIVVSEITGQDKKPSSLTCPQPQYTSPHCPKVITKARNIKTGEVKEFPDGCLPLCWVETQ